jgi:hypothetical protein
MAKKSIGTYFLYSLPFIVGGVLVFFYIRKSKKIREKARSGVGFNENEPEIPSSPTPSSPTPRPTTTRPRPSGTTTGGSPSGSTAPSTSGIPNVGRPAGDYTTKYTVTVSAGSNLNIRTDPNTTASILEKVPRGTILFGKPSSTAGWIAISKDGRTLYGYASKQFLSIVI